MHSLLKRILRILIATTPLTRIQADRPSTEAQDQEWEARCEQASIPPEDLNKLIIEFLATEVCVNAFFEGAL
jgi:hypothetical protein